MAVRRYRAVGGFFGWRIPVATACLLAIAALTTNWTAMLVVAAVAVVAATAERGMALEVTPRGLSREFRIGRAMLRSTPVLAWHAADEIVTAWRRPHDYTVLETIVRGRGVSIRFTSVMGYRAYHALLSDVVAHASVARRTGLTDQVLREPPQPAAFGRRTVAVAAAVVLVVTWALVA